MSYETVLSKVILGLLGFSSANEQKCIICEHIGFAETEMQAHLNLLGIRDPAGSSTPEGGAALKALYQAEAGGSLTFQNNYCLSALVPTADGGSVATMADGSTPHSKPLHIQTIGSGTNGFSYCVAQFFVYYAQDMDK